MKFKHFIASVGLALVASLGVAAGLSVKKEAKAVKADEPADTWMINISMDFNAAVDWEGFDPDSVWVQTYTDGVGNARWYQMYALKSGSEYFQVNATFPDGYSFDRIQYKFSQGGVEKWGQPQTVGVSKESYPVQLYATFENSWPEDNVFVFYLYDSPNMFVKYKSVNYYFEADVANKRFVAKDVVSDESDYYTIYYRKGWSCCSETLSEQGAEAMSYISAAWCSMKAGTYDVILKNDASSNGVVDIIKHVDPTDTFVYYVTNSKEPTVDYIYSWGGSEQFGAFPGTSIASLVAADKAKELTGNGVVHFQGGDDPKLIYKIQIKTGYPVGDSMFMFNNGTSEFKSDERAIAAEHAYWWVGPANHDAAQAIQFLELLEAYRNAVEDYSVCNISKENATVLVGLYSGFSDEQKNTYINVSTVYTWADAKKEGNTLVSVSDIVARLTIIANSSGSSRARINSASTRNSIITVAIITTLFVGVSAVSLLLLFKRRKHN